MGAHCEHVIEGLVAPVLELVDAIGPYPCVRLLALGIVPDDDATIVVPQVNEARAEAQTAHLRIDGTLA